jgi:dephospho-CoA kinase
VIVLGLTGSIAMGKSTTAAMFRRLGVPVDDADRTVHRLLAPGGAAVPAVGRAFPGVVAGAGVDRAALGARVFADAAALARLEAILHPLVRDARRAFIARQRRHGRRLVVVDIPLLYETGADRDVDAVAVVSAPAFLQRQRLLARPAMTEARIAAVLARQLADAEKRRRADYVIPSGLGRAAAFRAVRRIVADLGGGGRPGASR